MIPINCFYDIIPNCDVNVIFKIALINKSINNIFNDDYIWKLLYYKIVDDELHNFVKMILSDDMMFDIFNNSLKNKLIKNYDYVWKILHEISEQNKNKNKDKDNYKNEYKELINLNKLKNIYYPNGIKVENMFTVARGLIITIWEIRIINNDIEKIPFTVFNLTNLKFLDLSHNQLKKIPKKISDLINLERITLNSNKIKKIPKEISKLINLQYLYLNNNEIKKIPKELSNLINLQRLHLENNKIKKIPDELSKIDNLTLYLKSNKIFKFPEKLLNYIKILLY